MRSTLHRRPRLERLEDRLAPAFAAVGVEVRVNTFTTGNQSTPRVASDADGDYVAVWASNGQDGSGLGIFAQRYSSGGTFLGSEFRVNAFTTGGQFLPAVAMDADGDFVVAWVSDGQDGAGYGVYARRYNSGGVAVGGEFQVASTTTSDQSTPAVGMNAAGEFVISWASPDGNAYGVFARRYNVAGAPLSGEIPVNSVTNGAQFNPTVGVDAAGGFVIAWQDSVNEGNGDGIVARLFDSAGAPLQPSEFQVNQFETGNQNAPVLAMSLSGTFVIAWQSAGQDGSGNAVIYKRFFADGRTAAAELQANIITTNSQSRPAIAMSAGGDFVISFQSNGQESTGNYGIYARRYLASGTALSGEVHVNTFTTGSQNNAAIASDGDGDFVVVWQSAGQDGGGDGVYAQRYTDFNNNDDTANPFVAAVTASGSPTTIRPGARVGGPIGGLTVAFSEAVSPVAATNTANYRLSRNGVDVGAFISGIVYGYNAALNRNEAAIAFSTPLGVGLYEFRLLSSMTDPPGNRFDGRAGGSGFSSDYRLEFSVVSVPAAGPEVRVNTQTTEGQNDPAVAAAANGDYVVIWSSRLQDPSGYGVYGQRYNAAGVPQGFEFRVNTFTAGDQFTADVAMDADGDFVVVWRSYGQDGSGDGIYVQRFNAGGVPQGAEFRVNITTTDDQQSPSVAMDADGDFVVAWASSEQDGSGIGIFAQRFSASGIAQGGEIAVNNITNGNQSRPSVAIDPNGGFVVAWESPSVDAQGNGIAARQFSATGLPLGSQFQVNQFFLNDQEFAAVAMGPAGNFVIAWHSEQNLDLTEVVARVYNSAGLPLTNEFRVNTFTMAEQEAPAIAITAAGDFLVSWASDTQDGAGTGVYAQRYSAAGLPSGGEFRVNTTTTNLQSSPAVAANGAGDFVVAWTSYGQDGSRFGVYAQRYVRALNVETVRPAGAAVPITPGSAVVPSITNLIATMSGPAATTGAGSVTNVANWQLTRNGVPVPAGITGITFGLNAATNKFEATVSVATLTDGTYTLTALPSILDPDGRPLDGNFDGVPGGAYSLTFDVRPKPPSGPETRVNTTTTTFTAVPAVAMDRAGNYVVVWYSFDGSNSGVFGQRYNAVGVAQGGEFLINTHTTGSQFDPTVAMDAAGNFVVTWCSNNQDGDGLGIYGQRFNAAGVAQGLEFRINTFVISNQLEPAVAMDADGDFVVTWASYNQDGFGYGVYARRFNSAGIALGGEIAVNQVTTNDQLSSVIAMDSAGNFVITWRSIQQDGSLSGVYARRFDAVGAARGPEFQVNQFTTDSQSLPAIALDAAGGFVIAWQSTGQDGDSAGIYARRYGATGQALAGEFRVNTVTSGVQSNPAIAMDAAGDFVIAWASTNQDGSGDGVYAKLLTPVSVSGEFRVNSFTSLDQDSPKVAMDADGDFVVVWVSDDQGGSDSGIYSQRFGGGVAPTVTQALVNGSTASQRSRVTSIDVTFSAQVTFAGPIANAFTLVRNGGGAVSFTASANVVGGVTVVTLNNFTGGETQSGSLRDGRYTLTAVAAQISSGGQQMASDFTFGDAQGLYRFYGDMNGDRRIDISDFGFFSLAYLSTPNFNPALDFNNDGRIDISDFGQFSLRYFTNLP